MGSGKERDVLSRGVVGALALALALVLTLT